MTRANILGIYKRLSAYTGKHIWCRTYLGRAKKFAQCRMFIKTPYYTGDSELCILRKLVVDLMIGQLQGINLEPLTI